MSTINITINSREIVTEGGKTILEVALKNGIFIPNLCYDPRLEPYGGCRLCLVEVKGANGFVPACTTFISDGMVVATETVALQQTRKTIVELILSDHPAECMTCEISGQCNLQDLAYTFKIDRITYQGERHNYAIQDFNPLIERNYNKCILCGRCSRICDEVQGVGIYDFINRGFGSMVTTPFNRSLTETDCEFCGQCVSTCPSGALVDRPRKYKGRIWEVKKVETICPYCGVGCTIELQVKNHEIVGVSAPLEKGVNKGNLCVKGRYGYEFVNHADRLTSPLIKKNGKFIEASWEEALSLVVKRLLEIKDKFGPDSIGGFSSAKCTNEENYIFQKFIRAVIGTNNVDHCARLCHSSSAVGLAMAFGTGASTGAVAEIPDADVIFTIGSNTTESHPVIGANVRRAARNGVKLIVADPRKISLTKRATVWMRHKAGTDVALLNGMMHVIIKEGLANKDFIARRTENYDEFAKVVEKYTPAVAEKITGVPANDIIRAARIYATAKAAIINYSMGITQHTSGVEKVLSIANLAMLTGHIGRWGASVNPLRGQNNVQGACDMGALPDVYTGYQPVRAPEIREKFERAWGVTLSSKPGLTVTEIINSIDEGGIEGGIRALYIMGENPVLSDPDTNHTKKALAKLDFLVVQDIFLSETAEFADVVLPAVSFAEKDGTFTNTDRHVQRVRKAINPIGNSREDSRIICELSKRMGYPIEYSSPSEVMDEIASLTPSYGGISYSRIEKGGIQWPCPAPDHPGTKFLHKDKFTRGRGKFHPVEYRIPTEEVDSEYPLVLTTGRWLFQYHTGTMSRRAKGIDEIAPEAFVEINPADAERYGIKDMEMVKAISRRGEIRIRAKVTDKSPAGTVFIPFHFWEAAANVLTINALDPLSKIPEYKVCAIRLEPLT